jgi:hypothetical protein
MEPLSANDPRTIGGFRLRARLGAGGMGQVYLGFSPAGRAVAVKVVHPALARDGEFLRRFAREAAAARAVSGMYTAPVVAAGLDDDPPWLATVYVPGPSLADFVAQYGPLPEAAVWRLAAGLTEALQAVHGCGLVHRDLKPSNVLLAADGPHVIDFGISRALDGTALTATGMVVGTPGYMSPEQAEGAQAGPASDMFSLGCVLAFAATGNAPYGNGSAASVLYRVVTGQPDLAGVPARLREVVTACLAKNPAERPGPAHVAARISREGPGVPGASPGAFWPAPVAEAIRASQPGPGQQMATHPATVRNSANRPRTAPLPPGPRTAPVTAWPQAPIAGAPAIPGSVRTAVRLMYAGAAVSMLGTLVNLAIIGQLKAAFLAHHPLTAHPLATVRVVQSVAGLLTVGVIISGAVSVSLWLWLASAARRGRGWVRTAGTVLFGIGTLGLLGTLGRRGIPVAKEIGVVAWLIGLAAVIALWQRRSREWMV